MLLSHILAAAPSQPPSCLMSGPGRPQEGPGPSWFRFRSTRGRNCKLEEKAPEVLQCCVVGLIPVCLNSIQKDKSFYNVSRSGVKGQWKKILPKMPHSQQGAGHVGCVREATVPRAGMAQGTQTQHCREHGKKEADCSSHPDTNSAPNSSSEWSEARKDIP